MFLLIFFAFDHPFPLQKRMLWVESENCRGVSLLTVNFEVLIKGRGRKISVFKKNLNIFLNIYIFMLQMDIW